MIILKKRVKESFKEDVDIDHSPDDPGQPSMARQVESLKEAEYGVLHLKNKVQAALWNWEIRGQLSDGAWENSSPYDHWKAWNKAKVVIDGKLENSVSAQKRNYGLYTLIQYVGDRMVNICNLVHNGYDGDDIHDTYAYETDWDKLENSAQGGDKYWVDKFNKIKKIFGTKLVYDQALKGPYTVSSLRKELADIMTALRTTVY